ncbi:hypothetical protein [Leptolyngbya sp. FACHB-17]|nr:hypothetical protein [Leptolyngbya sp. FACHB-17]
MSLAPIRADSFVLLKSRRLLSETNTANGVAFGTGLLIYFR